MTNTTSNHESNPFYAGIATFIEYEYLGANSSLNDDPEVYVRNSISYIPLGCEVTVYNVTYSWVNSTLAAITLAPSEDDVASLVRIGFSNGITVGPQLSYTAISTATQSNTANGLATFYARSLEHTLISFSANICSRKPTSKSSNVKFFSSLEFPKHHCSR